MDPSWDVICKMLVCDPHGCVVHCNTWDAHREMHLQRGEGAPIGHELRYF